ncbi:putative sodium-coupled neutral amino acid transporter 11 [Sycon ciliatum]|uniref:putative sodium-coupled neutral amino acid transporter 11 n=1 Tax=Sycon ciliatum TaxID=27933 RepID=UPI0031F71D69
MSSSTSIKSKVGDAFNGGTFEQSSYAMNPTELQNGSGEIPSGNDSSTVELTSISRVASDPNGDETQLIAYEEKIEDGTAKSGFGMASYNMINSIIGAGIIGLPFAISQAGFILGTFLLFFMALVTDYSLRLLVETGLLIGVTSYQGTMDKMFGKAGFFYLSACQFFYPFFAMIGYTIIIGDTIPKVLEQAGAGGVLINEMFIKFVVTVLVMWPLSLYRDIAKLGKVSFLAIMFIIFLCLVVLIRINNGSTATYDAPPFQFFNYNIAQSLSIMTFAYMCHHNTFLIYSSLEAPSMQKYGRVVHVSVAAAAVVAFILALGGYITFRTSIRGDLLQNYCIGDTLVNVARVGYAFVVMFTFPIEMFVCREVLAIGYSWYNRIGSKAESLPFHVTSTLAVGVVILGIGIPVSKLDVVLEFSGALFGTPLAFVFPPACYLRATKGQSFNFKRIKACICLIFGTVLTVLGTVVAIIEASKGVTEDNLDWPYCATDGNYTLGNVTTGMASAPTTFTATSV